MLGVLGLQAAETYDTAAIISQRQSACRSASCPLVTDAAGFPGHQIITTEDLVILNIYNDKSS